MEQQNSNKTNNLGAKIILVVLIITISCFITSYINSKPFDPIKEMREDFVSNYSLLGMQKTEMWTMVYSFGQVNEGKDYMYFVDMVKKPFLAYKWVGGGGHISRDLTKGKDFIFSSQLLNEKQNVKPTIFGVINDDNVSKITVSANGNKTHEAAITRGVGVNEKFYIISFDEAVSSYKSFIYTVTYKNGDNTKHIITGEQDISKLQKGLQKYFYYED